MKLCRTRLGDDSGIQRTFIGDLPPQLPAPICTDINVRKLTVQGLMTENREHISSKKAPVQLSLRSLLFGWLIESYPKLVVRISVYTLNFHAFLSARNGSFMGSFPQKEAAFKDPGGD
ncbi:hypothetical protein [Rhizobium laguerreae]|uniref:hypothetical protein n=1 Tax=Rhizobium laguerreae TaxID=1076926 RepID=UPI001C90584C|nr:hypothetical protein [Rhizobium laguerreae]MBY3038466.1 hypothetical protein [Rhizobium laguerreae]